MPSSSPVNVEARIGSAMEGVIKVYGVVSAWPIVLDRFLAWDLLVEVHGR